MKCTICAADDLKEYVVVEGGCYCTDCVNPATIHLLYKELNLYKNELRKSSEACSWMFEDKSLGLKIGDRTTVEGVAALRKQRDTLQELIEEACEVIKKNMMNNLELFTFYKDKLLPHSIKYQEHLNRMMREVGKLYKDGGD